MVLLRGCSHCFKKSTKLVKVKIKGWRGKGRMIGDRGYDKSDFLIFMLIDRGNTQAKISKILGVTRQAVNKKFRRYLDEGLIAESKNQTRDLRYLTLGHDKIYSITEKGRELIFLGFRREYTDEISNAIAAIRYYLDILECYIIGGGK